MQIMLDSLRSGSLDELNDISAVDTAHRPRHRWYYFKEAFSPTLVEYALADSGCTRSDLVVDPFNGSGTVVLSSVMRNTNAIGFEVNPFLAFVSRTKLSNPDPHAFDACVGMAVQGIKQGAISPLENFSTFSERPSKNKWLFNRDVLQGFEGGWQAVKGHSPAAQNLVRLALIRAAMQVSNAEKDGKCLRYRSDWQQRAFDRNSLVQEFTEIATEFREDITTYVVREDLLADIKLADSRKISGPIWRGDHFRLCVTSPPYLNSFDYTDVYRPELFLGKFVTTQEDLRELRHRTIRSHVQANWAVPSDCDFGQHFLDSFQELSRNAEQLWDKRIPHMVQAYFEDMKVVLRNMRALAEPQASLWLVVSTSSYAGIEIPVDLIIADIGCRVGWYLRDVRTMRHLRRISGQQYSDLYKKWQKKPYLRESLIILDASPRK